MAGDVLDRIHITSEPAQLKRVRDTVRTIGQRLELQDSVTEEMVVGINEACMNIMQHGYQDNSDGEILLEIIAGEQELIFRITDQAPRVDPRQLVSRPLEDIRPGGLGIHFIRSVMDSAEYRAGDNNIGNILELRKKTTPKETP